LRSHFLWQYQSRVDPLLDIPVPEQWYPVYPDQVPGKVPNTHTQFAFHPEPASILDQFYPQFEIPIHPAKNQYLYQDRVDPLLDIPVPTQWYPDYQIPVRPQRNQYMYPYFFIDADFSSVPVPPAVALFRTGVVVGKQGFYIEDPGNIDIRFPFETD